MNRADSFVMLAAIMSDKLGEQAMTIADLEDHITRDHGQMDEMQRTISDFKRQCEEKYEEKESLRSRNEELYAQVRKLQTENHQLRFGGRTAEETATAYMVNQGAEVWASGERIACIKVCREVSGWGLKETKDFCEAYMARKVVEDAKRAELSADGFLARQKDTSEGKEESGPHTKRSSQIPAGVGTNVRKST